MNCKVWKIVSFLFFGIVIAESFYMGLRFNYWWGLVACGVGFLLGTIHRHYREKVK